jgi:hypothetical protein
MSYDALRLIGLSVPFFFRFRLWSREHGNAVRPEEAACDRESNSQLQFRLLGHHSQRRSRLLARRTKRSRNTEARCQGERFWPQLASRDCSRLGDSSVPDKFTEKVRRAPVRGSRCFYFSKGVLFGYVRNRKHFYFLQVENDIYREKLSRAKIFLRLLIQKLVPCNS